MKEGYKKGEGRSDREDKRHRYGAEGDFGHGENRMYRVGTDYEKEGLKEKYSYKPGDMGYSPEAFDYDY